MSDQELPSSPPARANSSTPAPRAFKPRAGVQRRTKTERDKFLKEEADREAKRVKDAAKSGVAAIGGSRGGRAARGRGAAAQSDARARNVGEAAGVFGANTGEKPATRAKGALGAGSDELIDDTEVSKAQEAVKTNTGAATKAKKHVIVTDPKEQGPPDATVSSRTIETKNTETTLTETAIEVDEEPDEPRRDIERIWISSDDEQEEDSTNKGKEKARSRSARPAGGLRPVRAPRTVKEDKEDGIARAKTPTRAPRRPDTEPIDVDEMDVDEPEFLKEAPSSPELKKKTIKRPAGKARDVKFATETPEERTERLRVAEDTNTLRSILTPETQSKTKIGGSSPPAGDGKLFLLQFPPLTPQLIDPGAPREEDDDVAEVKPERLATVAPAADKGKTAAIKKDPDGLGRKPLPSKPKDPHDHNGVFAACCPPERLPAGLVGKLNVHASGKITLDWGGTDMEVKLGTEVDFLQDAVLIQTRREDNSPPSSPKDTPGARAGAEDDDSKAFALGQVEGKMVVIPDWSKLYD